jgi:phenylpropionate dioxygenase-like ring-hydroxylating dioxygenase large terminal subunit
MTDEFVDHTGAPTRGGAATHEPAAHHGSFLNNAWYPASWAENLAHKPLERLVCGRKLVLWRTEDGNPTALSGLCPHRFAALARGQLLPGDRLQCPYHGIEYGADGRCVHNPHGPAPKTLALTPYAAVERHSLIWVWIGDRERADPELIPDFSCLTDPNYYTIRGELVTEANFEFVTDNLLDLSHVAYLHKDGLGSDAVAAGRHSVSRSGTTIWSNRWCPDGDASPVWGALYINFKRPDFQGKVDHWLNMRWDAPAAMLLDVGIAPAGQDRSVGITAWGAHILLPETETSTRYFWAAARDFALDTDLPDAGLRAAIEKAFIEEDKPMLQEIQSNLGGRRFEELGPVILSFDAGAVQARRLLADLRNGRKTLQPMAAR